MREGLLSAAYATSKCADWSCFLCRDCHLKPKCCPNMPSRRIVRDVKEAARYVARTLAKTEGLRADAA